jgi:hypothetical protein
MNNDQIKALLRKLAPEAAGYTVLMSGKESKKVDGLYKPESREIILHNKNFKNDSQLIYTAIHELAHHIHFTSDDPPKSTRAHTNAYWSIFHTLLRRAEDLGLYENLGRTNGRLAHLAEKIRKECLAVEGEAMSRMGRLLAEALEVCHQEGANFEDFLDRVLVLPRNTAKLAIKAYSQAVPTDAGQEAIKVISRGKDPRERQEIFQKLQNGHSHGMIKQSMKLPPSVPSDPEKVLIKEKAKIEGDIRRLQKRLAMLEKELEEIGHVDRAD